MIYTNSFLRMSRILIIDDLPIGLSALTFALEKEGHEVVFYESSQNIRQAVIQINPDLIVLDIVMPGISGIDVCRELKMFPQTQDIPIIFISAKEDKETELTALKAGGADFIAKPIYPATAKERIRKHLRIKHLQDELHKLSRTDALTGLFNRQHIMDALEQEWSLLSLLKAELGLLMLDIDHFKAYNDHYGHIEGDECLRSVSQAISQTLIGLAAQGAMLGRYGGEEFVLLLPVTSLAQVHAIGNGILEGVRGINLRHERSPTATYVSISVGGSSLIPSPHRSKEYLLKQADNNLYLAKKQGRNRCVVSNALPISTWD